MRLPSLGTSDESSTSSLTSSRSSRKTSSSLTSSDAPAAVTTPVSPELGIAVFKAIETYGGDSVPEQQQVATTTVVVDEGDEEASQGTNEPEVVRDMFGFPVPSFLSPFYVAYETDVYEREVREQEERFSAYLAGKGSSRKAHGGRGSRRSRGPGTPSLPTLLRHGIPSKYRGRLWLDFTGVAASTVRVAGAYGRILRANHGKLSEAIEQIEKDVKRTFPQDVYDANFQGALRRVLVAYSWRNPAVGYTQSMNFVAGTLLIFLDEEDAFWMLVHIVEVLLVGYYSQSMFGATIDGQVLELLLAQRHPAIKEHCDAIGLSVRTLVMQWFLVLFVTVTPTETAFRIWDNLFYYGPPVLFEVVLRAMSLQRSRILRCDDEMEVMALLKQELLASFDATTLLTSSHLEDEAERATIMAMRDERLAALGDGRPGDDAGSSSADGSNSVPAPFETSLLEQGMMELSVRDWTKLNTNGHQRTYDDGDVVVRAGMHSGSLYRIASGCFRIVVGHATVICLTKGDVFGEWSYLGAYESPVSVIASRESMDEQIPTVMEMEISFVRAFLAIEPGLCARFHRFLAALTATRLKDLPTSRADVLHRLVADGIDREEETELNRSALARRAGDPTTPAGREVRRGRTSRDVTLLEMAGRYRGNPGTVHLTQQMIAHTSRTFGIAKKAMVRYASLASVSSDGPLLRLREADKTVHTFTLEEEAAARRARDLLRIILRKRGGGSAADGVVVDDTAVVLMSREPRADYELPLAAGASVVVTEMGDDGWWMGESQGKFGAFPSDYVRHGESSGLSLLSATDWQQLLHGASCVTFEDGETVLVDGSVAQLIGQVLEGTLRVVKTARTVDGSRGTSLCVARMGPGATFGEVNFLLGSRATASLVAEGQVKCQFIVGSTLVSTFSQDLPLAGRFYRYLAMILERRVADRQNSLFLGE